MEDELYEHINAPKWVDFTAIHDAVDDEAWFCRPGELLFPLDRSLFFISLEFFCSLDSDKCCFLLALCRL